MVIEKFKGTDNLQYNQARNWFNELKNEKVLSDTQITHLKNIIESLLKKLAEDEFDAFCYRVLKSNKKLTTPQRDLIEENIKKELQK